MAGGICVRLGDNCVKVKRGGVELRGKDKGTPLPTMYPPMEHLSNDHEDRANQHENSHKLMQWSGASCCEFDGKSMEMRKHHDQNSQWSESYCRTNSSIRRNNKFQGTRLWESQSVIQLGKVTIWDYKNYNRVHQVNHSDQNLLVSPYDQHLSLQRHKH